MIISPNIDTELSIILYVETLAAYFIVIVSLSLQQLQQLHHCCKNAEWCMHLSKVSSMHSKNK